MVPLLALRGAMVSSGIDAFILPHTDPRGSEYPAPRYERLQRLTGFSGSAGTLAVLAGQAALFTDGRYLLQAADQVNPDLITVIDSTKERPSAYLQRNLQPGMRLGYDPELFTVSGLRRLAEALPEITLVPLPHNPVDVIAPFTGDDVEPVEFDHPLIYAGVSAADKQATVAEQVRQAGADAVLLTDAASISWLLNRRSRGIPYLPVVEGLLLLHADGRAERIADAAALPDDCGRLVLLDENAASVAVADALRQRGAVIEHTPDLCAQAKACKNASEIAGMQAAHIRDGAALWQVICAVQRGEVSDELGVAELCRQYRAADPLYVDLSFAPICGFAANGAIIHYRADERTNQPLRPGNLLLIDSGGHYLDGTTDVTRTVAVGTPSPDMRRHYTLVLKGHIALTGIVWPADAGVTGAHLDVLARAPLWHEGLDYAHGTGHGVGMCLAVHEAPPSISLRSSSVLRSGMVVSNEPGFYLPGNYGIRIENLQTVTEAAEGLKFEPLTVVPYDRLLIDPALLSPGEINFINHYHAKVHEVLRPGLAPADAEALAEACRPL